MAAPHAAAPTTHDSILGRAGLPGSALLRVVLRGGERGVVVRLRFLLGLVGAAGADDRVFVLGHDPVLPARRAGSHIVMRTMAAPASASPSRWTLFGCSRSNHTARTTVVAG